MTWARLDDGYWSHPKILEVGNEGAGVYSRLLSYCAQHLTDGRVTRALALSIAKRSKVLERLITARLLVEIDAGTLEIHGYLERNPSRAQVERDRAANRVRQQTHYAKTLGKTAERTEPNAVRNAVTNGIRHAVSSSVTNDDPIPTHPNPSQPKEREETPPDGGVARVRESAPAAPAREGLTLSADTPAVERKRPARRAKPAPAPDPTPDPSSPAGRVYSAIVGDAALAPITRGPGDLSLRLVALCEGTGVDPLREVLALGAWLAGGGTWTDGRAGLLRAIKRKIDDAARLPKPATGTGSSTTRAPERIDYQGRRVVGSAGLPPGSAWEKTRAEFEAEEDRIYADFVERTQPRAKR